MTECRPPADAGLIPICLVTGFLGSGKTTFLKQIVSRSRHRRLVYLVNEFSPHDIDGAMVSKENANVVSIPGGSIFCKCLVTEFIAQLTAVASMAEVPEGVVIEASGMANPKVMAEMLRETRLDSRFELARIVSIVDPGSFMKLRVTLPNIVAQIEACDTALVNKVDLHDDAAVSETIAALRAIRPDLEILTCSQADAQVSLFSPVAVQRDLHGDYATCKDPNYDSTAVTFVRNVDPEALRSHLLAAAADVYRAKGNVPTAEGVLHVEFTASGLTLDPLSACEDATLVLIMRGTPSPAGCALLAWLSRYGA